MSHTISFPHWIARVRGWLLYAVVMAFFVAGAFFTITTNLQNSTWLGQLGQAAYQALPWVLILCWLTACGGGFALWSTWKAHEWWVERWANGHKDYIG